MRQIILLAVMLCMAPWLAAQNVSVHADNKAASEVFRSIVEQTDMNFVYSSDMLDGLYISVDADSKPLKKVLKEMFRDTGVEFSIKGNNIMLKRRKIRKADKKGRKTVYTAQSNPDTATMLNELVVVSRLEAPAVETSEVGARKITADEINSIPALFGENDVIKALQQQPGVAEGIEGLAGMYVHGGNADENLYMLDNVPVYQANHFAGLFSAFNTDIIRYIDFFKSSIPAKYDGRLSSFMDVRLKNGNQDGHHGTGHLGLTSGAFNIGGPIGEKTSYIAGIRRSWYDILTIPAIAIINSKGDEEKVRLRYYFMDLNAKMTHRFSPYVSAFISAYYGNDLLKSGSEDKFHSGEESDKYDLNWGNLIVQGGVNYKIRPHLSSEFTAAYTRFFSTMKEDYLYNETEAATQNYTHTLLNTDNHIDDWIFRGDFDWQASENSRIRFGAGYTRHSFLPGRTAREYTFNDTHVSTRDSVRAYGANEFNVYIEDDIKFLPNLRANLGVHASLFNIEGKTSAGLSPRVSVSWRIKENIAIKGAYSRTVQYVHQLSESYLSLPTDQWIPITGNLKPQTADKISVGGYWQSDSKKITASVEAYYKFMHNLVDYRDEYYLRPPLEIWNARLTSGRGTAKGIDFCIEKVLGKLTGRISYSLAWADRTFKDKNGGKTFPARFDNRHTINLSLTWKISGKVSLNAAWTGHSGNRFTLLAQVWDRPGFGGEIYDENVPLRAPLNSYQLPFYHRLDLSCTVKNKRGYWTFGLYNAYCHMNTIAIKQGYKEVVEQTPYGVSYTTKPVFEKVKLLPIIPSVSYTWQF